MKLQEFLLDELGNSKDNPGFTNEGNTFNNELYVSVKAFWDQFVGEITHETTCTSCKNTTKNRESTTYLLLKFPDDNDKKCNEDCTVQSLIEYHLQEECIEGYRCSHCPQKPSAKRMSTITKYPSFLCVLLCRNFGHANDYISSAVDFPIHFSYTLGETVLYTVFFINNISISTRD